jgi:hypothetical protein
MNYLFHKIQVTLPVVVLLLATSTLASAQRAVSRQAPQSRQLQQINSVETWPSKPKRWALVIAVHHFRQSHTFDCSD